VKLGLLTPVLTLNPRVHNDWERDGTVDDVVTVARAADELGFHHLTCSEHVAVPTQYASTRGVRYFDPLSTLGYLAARTSAIRLAAHVVVLGYHHPLEIAKRYGTLDRLSGGRLVLGVGVGSLEEEFGLLDADFAGRGARADDALRALRAALGRPDPAYSGSHYEFDGFVVEPHAVQDRVPIWVGGRTARSLRRALELGDGWTPFGLSPGEVAALLQRHGRPAEVVLAPEPALDVIADPAAATATVERYVAAGATALNVRVVSRSAGHCCEQLEGVAHLVRQYG
jgi:probable F420-dependent oxidoreductase